MINEPLTADKGDLFRALDRSSIRYIARIAERRNFMRKLTPVIAALTTLQNDTAIIITTTAIAITVTIAVAVAVAVTLAIATSAALAAISALAVTIAVARLIVVIIVIVIMCAMTATRG
jgi:hypothetical protein